MKRSGSILWLCVAALFAVAATLLILSYMVTDPGHVMIQLGGDGGKNYFTFLYHSIYDNGVWFEGMNYPYGEHIIYADGQPVLSSLLNRFPHVSVRQALAIMNLAISFSYVLAIIFTYKILFRFGVKPFIAIVFACLINLLAPQVLRLRAHFALAYLCPIPMLFYWTLLFHYTRQWKWPVYIFIMGFIMAFIHLYIGAIIFIWVAFYSIGYILFIKVPLRERLKHITPLLIAVAALYIVIKVCIGLTDPITDRPVFPFHAMEDVTHIKDILSSPYAPVWQYIMDKTGFKKISDASEGYSYIGISTIFTLLISLLAGIIMVLRKKPKDEMIVSERGFSPVWLFVGIGSLLLAMGAPFIWHMQWLLNYLSIFRQFRAMGRFSWIFYYIISVYGVVVIHTWYLKYVAKGKPMAGYAILLVAFILWSTDVCGIVKYTRGYIATGLSVCDEFFYKNEPVKWPQYLDEHHYKGSDFQGIILLPFFVLGSEKLWVGGDPSWQFSIGMRVAIEFHLPIVDVMMSRTSWSITEKQVKTIGGPYADKPMLHDLKSKKPFLLLQYADEPIDPDQQYLYQASDYLGKNFGCYIYACYPERILANDQKYADTVNSILLYMRGEDTCVGACGTWYADHYNTQHGIAFLGGSGAMPITREDSVIALIPIAPLMHNELYEFSAWFLLGSEDYRSPYISIHLLDSAHNVIGYASALTKESVDNDKMWFRTSVFFTINTNCRYIECTLMNVPNPSYKAMDELLLRPADAVIISRSKDGSVMVNNHRFGKNQ